MQELSECDNKNENNDISFNVILPLYNDCNSFLPFVHALKIAYASRGELEIVDVRNDIEVVESIGVRLLLERWGILSAGSQRADVRDIGLRVKKVVKRGNKKREIIKRLYHSVHDVLVIGSGNCSGLLQSFREEMVQKTAQHFDNAVLIVPPGVKGFVSQQTGEIVLNKILVSAGNSYGAVNELLKKFKTIFPLIKPEIVNLTENDSASPRMDIEEWQSQDIRICRSLKAAIIDASKKHQADMIVIVYKKENGRDKKTQILNAMQVLKEISCPIFILPSIKD